MSWMSEQTLIKRIMGKIMFEHGNCNSMTPSILSEVLKTYPKRVKACTLCGPDEHCSCEEWGLYDSFYDTIEYEYFASFRSDEKCVVKEECIVVNVPQFRKCLSF